MAVQLQTRSSSHKLTRRTDRRRRRLSLESLENRLVLHGAESVSPFNGEADVAVNVNVVATFDFDADPATVNDSTFELRDPQGTLIPAAVSYDAPSRTATLNPDQNLADVADYYEARIVGGPSGVYELGGSELEEDLTWYFITQPPTYSDTAVFTGLVNPTAIEFAPDGSVFVAEKGGLVKVYDDLNDTTPTTFADLRINVHNYWDRGLLGLAVHPDYPATPEVFVLYTYDAPLSGSVAAPAWGTGGGTGDPGPGTTGDPSSVSGRLSRLVANGSGVWDGIEHVLIEDWGQQYPSHSVGSIAFGADGALYASGGDGASFNFADYGQNDGLLDDDPALGDTRLLDPVDEGGAYVVSICGPHPKTPTSIRSRSTARSFASIRRPEIRCRTTPSTIFTGQLTIPTPNGLWPTVCGIRFASRCVPGQTKSGSATSVGGSGKKSTLSAIPRTPKSTASAGQLLRAPRPALMTRWTYRCWKITTATSRTIRHCTANPFIPIATTNPSCQAARLAIRRLRAWHSPKEAT